MPRYRKNRSSSFSQGGERHRSSSFGDHFGLKVVPSNSTSLAPVSGDPSDLDGVRHAKADDVAESHEALLDNSRNLMTSLLYLREGSNILHAKSQQFNLTMSKLLLDRLRGLDECGVGESSLLQSQWLLQPDAESGYTPLHRAMIDGDLSRVLLLLRHAMDFHQTHRFGQRPIAALQVLENNEKSASSKYGDAIGRHPQKQLLHKMVSSVDQEGLTPLELLLALQRDELARCRNSMAAINTAESPLLDCAQDQSSLNQDATHSRMSRSRQSSFDIQGGNDDEDLDLLREHGRLLMSERPTDNGSDEDGITKTDSESFACEVVTYGRAHHCALGVHSGSSDSGATSPVAISPQRVKSFAQDAVGRDGSAVFVAAAAHHTLVLCRDGKLYAFGLGKGGRLGTGNTNHCPTPTKVLLKHQVVHVAAAENHSLAVTRNGAVYSWGSNRFGQLGGVVMDRDGPDQSNIRANSGATPNCRSVPRRVDDLKQIHCVAVAAGERHSVALTRRGEVYVWGDNSAGQLGVSRRSGVQKVQRVTSLWNTNVQKRAIAIAASEYSTLALIGKDSGASTNAVYTWGHGTSTPSKVHFGHGGSNRNDELEAFTRRIVNPVAIASGKYHHAFVTSEGRVYTLGFHADTRGRSTSITSKTEATVSYERTSSSSPQLVHSLLAERAVAIQASEHITAVITESGSLYTWGSALGKDVLGHPEVRWQPNPKRVSGVHRAVGVAVAKEHTVVLIGATFPSSSIPKTVDPPSLELLSASTIADHVDLFNVIPILIMAERMESEFLVSYCTAFIKANLDGVLNLGREGEMNQYLNDMLADGMHVSGKRFRDAFYHPLLIDVIMAGSSQHASFDKERFINTIDWMHECHKLVRSDSCAKRHLQVPRRRQRISSVSTYHQALRPRRSSSCSSEKEALNKTRPSQTNQESLKRCIEATSNMNLSTVPIAQAKFESLSKELRGVKKRLNQITKLEQSESNVLSVEQQGKIDRRPHLEKEMLHFERAIQIVCSRIEDLKISATKEELKEKQEQSDEKPITPDAVKDEPDTSVADVEPEKQSVSFVCKVCNIKCPDANSYELHQNGRKHRNKVALAAEEEERRVSATLTMKAQQKQLDSTNMSTPAPQKRRGGNPWNTDARPKYNLPPPPHATLPHIEPAPSESTPERNVTIPVSKIATPALRDIMQQEASKRRGTGTSAKLPSPYVPPVSSAPSPLAATGTQCLPKHLLTTHPSQSSPSLGDFLFSTPVKTPPPPPPSSKGCSKSAPWSPPAKPAPVISRATPPSAQSLRDIQKEESELRARQDHSFGKETGSWFIERRERASSLLTIQDKEREEREMIEEQFAIQAQIERENELRKAEEEKKSRPKSGGKKHKKGPKKEAQADNSGKKSSPHQNRNTKGKPKKSNNNSGGKRRKPVVEASGGNPQKSTC